MTRYGAVLGLLGMLTLIRCAADPISGDATHDTAASDALLDDVAFGESTGGPDAASDAADLAAPDLGVDDAVEPDQPAADVAELDPSGDASPEADTVAPAVDTCRAFVEVCTPACPADEFGVPDAECRQACLDQLSEQGAADLDAYLDCVVEANCFAFEAGDARTDCEETHCRAERIGCFHGVLPCAAIPECMNACPATGDDCLSACITEGSVDAQLTYYAISDCTRATCCAGDPTACTGAEFAACVAASYAEGGACEGAVAACLEDQ